jgi:hypothetical protein
MKRVYHWNKCNSTNNVINSNSSNNSQSNLPFLQKNDSHSSNKINIYKSTLRKNNSMALFNKTHNGMLCKDIMKYQYKNTNYVPLNNVNKNNSLLMYNSFHN